jgi:meso-butanediol dehydrogenase / (S,S)-butanediol dehydrogenase / diacetyl reductase
MLLESKIIIITGAGSGIGKAISIAMATEGATVVVTDSNAQWAKDTAAEIEKKGGKALFMQLDVTNQSEAQAVANRVIQELGHFDIWVNNAGVSSMRRFVDLTEQDWDFNMDVNAKGAFLCSQVAARELLKNPFDSISGLRGKIINVASMAGKRGAAAFLSHYVASKFAVVGLTQATAFELASAGITINSVCPGYVRTGMQEREVNWETILRGNSADDVRRFYINDTPLGRLETAEDVAKVVVFLGSSLSDFMTGVSVSVNGGSYMD